MKNNRNNYIGKMKKGFKQKLSLLMIACLLFTGFHGLTISGRAETPQKEQNNEIEVNGSQVKVQLLGEDLRRAATEAILKGEKLGKSNLLSYSKDQDLATEFEEYFDGEKEIYPIPLNSISENLEESLAEEEAGLQIYVERDAKNLERLVRQESKESLLLYSKESAVANLLPRAEEKTSVEKEEKASDSELIRDTELTGSELITFVYENKSEQKMTFQLSVDGNRYPKVSVAPKASLFKQFLSDAKKAQAEAKKNEGKEEKKEQASVSATEESKAEVKEAVAELKASEEAKQEESKEASDVELVSTAAEEHKEETQSVEVKEEKPESTEEKKEETVAESEAEKAEAPAESTQAEEKQSESKAKESKTEDKSLLKEITENSEEFLPELQSVRFTQYSLNELGRKSQNVEIEGFGNVQVFYEEAAFEGKDVVLEAKRLFKPEDEVEGEKLTEDQVKVLKEYSIYDDAASLDIRFVDKKDSAVEVEPSLPVSVRITIDKKALPENVSSDSISIHHLVENDETKEIEKVEMVVQPKIVGAEGTVEEASIEKFKETVENIKDSQESTLTDEDTEKNSTITKEFTVDSFSLYQVKWKEKENSQVMINCPPMRFHYVDKNFNEIGPTVRIDEQIPLKVEIKTKESYKLGSKRVYYHPTQGGPYEVFDDKQLQYAAIDNSIKDYVFYDRANPEAGKAYREFKGYKLLEVYPYKPGVDNLDTIVNNHENDYFDINYKYGPGLGDFRPGMRRIDNTGYLAPSDDSQNFVGNGSTPWYWKELGQINYCYAESYDFYFVYDIAPGKTEEVKEKFETQNEKYITKNDDGKTYNLTLTGQVKEESKQKLDIVFLVDVTKSRNLPFDFKDMGKRITTSDYANSKLSRKAKVEENIDSLVDSLSSNRNLDVQYALVGFGGSRDESGHKANMNANEMKVKDNSINVVDSPFNDLTYVGRFTSSANELKERVKNLEENEYEKTGANYTAAMMGLHYVLTGKVYAPYMKGKKLEKNGDARPDAKKIVIMIADGDPTYSYIGAEGVYDDTIKTTGIKTNPNGSKTDVDGNYSFFKTFQPGYSYGNGLEFSRVALNQARGVLSYSDENYVKYHAFYSIGVGNKENWKHLKELTEAHGPSEATGDDHRPWTDVPEKGSTKFIRAKSALLTGADSKVFDGSDPNKLAASFKELEKKLIPTDRPTQFSITDTLSENVDLVKNSTLEYGVYKMTDAVNGVKLNDKELKDLGNVSLVPINEIGANGKPKIGVKLQPDNFSLPAGYEIRVTAKIEPSKVAYEKLARNEANENQGGKRTDLYSLYKHYLGLSNPNNPYTSINDYKISEDEFGLWTNQDAKFNYTWKGKDNHKDYPNPIIKVKGGELKIEKQIKGLEGSAYLNSVGFTPLGKSVLKDITFTVYEVNEDGPDKEYLSFKPYQDEISGEQSNSGEFEVNGKKIVRDKAVYDETADILKLKYTITGLNPNKKYRVVEDVVSNSYKSDSSYGTGKKYRLLSNEVDITSYLPTDNNTVVIKNDYTQVKKKKVTISKVVKNKYNGDTLHPQDEKDLYDFYLRVYHPVKERDSEGAPKQGEPKPFTQSELTTLKNSFSGEAKAKFMNELVEVPPSSGTYALHFQMRHGDKLEIELDDDLSYDVSEKKVDGISDVKFLKSDTGKKDDWIKCSFGLPDQNFWFVCQLLQVKNDGYVKIINTSTRELPPPTGLVRDITPYLFGIFGFVAMAGAYLTISKKRREA